MIKMKDFFQWEGWNAISSICQILIALFALIAICITVNQISGKSKAKLDMSIKFGLGIKREKNSERIFPGFCILISNLGMAPIYISECGVEFFHGRKSKKGFFLSDELFVLQPGECITKSITNFDILIPELDDRISLHDKAKLYIKDGTGKTFYKKTKLDYAEFKFEFEKFVKRAEKSNARNITIISCK